MLRKISKIQLLFSFFLALALLIIYIANQFDTKKIIKIGVVNYLDMFQPAFDGFKQGMLELGYEEGTQLVYVYPGVAKGVEHIDQTVEDLLTTEKVDLLLTMGTYPTLSAQFLTQQHNNVPVIFAPLISPVEAGIVQSLAQPGANVTGVQNANNSEKALDWIFRVAPKTQFVYLFIHPDDAVSSLIYDDFEKNQVLYPKVIFRPLYVSSERDALGYLHNIPTETVILMVPTPSLGAMQILQEAAMAQGIFVAGYNVTAEWNLLSYSVDWFNQGIQASRLAHRVLLGADPAVVSVESAESFLNINLKNAHDYHFKIDARVLKVADNIIR